MGKIFTKRNITIIFAYFGSLFLLRYFETKHIKDLIEFIIMVISIPFILGFGKKAVMFCVITFCTVVMHLDHKSIYASLIVFTITCFIKRKYLIPLTIFYHLNIIYVLIFDKKNSIISVIVFYSICLLIFVLLFFYKKIELPELDLTPDEEKIIIELAKGKQLKEIDLFSKNTLTAKLQDACDRNNFMNRYELTYIYKLTNNCE